MNVKRNIPYAAYMILLLIAGYFGYIIGAVYYDGFVVNGLLGEELFELFQVYVVHPLHKYRGEYSVNAILLFMGLVFLYIIYDATRHRKFINGREYGSAMWGEPKRINRRYQDRKADSNNTILSNTLRMSLDTRFTRLNNNIIYIGGSGCGKSAFGVKPNLFQCNTSFVVTDPKGELLESCGNFLRSRGYRVRVLNLYEPEKSDKYNPFRYITSEKEIIQLVGNLIKNTTPKGSNPPDPFWEKAETMLLQALFLYVWMEMPKEKQNFRSVMDLLRLADKNEDEESELDFIFNDLQEKNPKHPAVRQYNKCMRGAEDTVRSIIISANSRLVNLENEEIIQLLDADDIDLVSLGIGIDGNCKTKTALFCVIPDSDKSFNFIVGMLYTQLFQRLYFEADFHFDGRLPIPIRFWMDEFYNVALPDDFDSLVSTMRSREISVSIIIQNLSQLKTLFEKQWETIVGNCDTLIYLGGNEQGSHKYMSEALDKGTYDKKSDSESFGQMGSSSNNYDRFGRELLTQGEVRKLHPDKCLVMIRGQDPVMDLKYETFKSAEFKEAEGMGKYQHSHIDEDNNAFNFMNHKAFEYINKVSRDKDKNVNVTTMNLEEFLFADFSKADYTNFDAVEKMVKKEPSKEYRYDVPLVAKVFHGKWLGKLQKRVNRLYRNVKNVCCNLLYGFIGMFVTPVRLAFLCRFNEEQFYELNVACCKGLKTNYLKRGIRPGISPEKMRLLYYGYLGF